ncbi:hypothetical protein WJX64_06895 [Leifsonia sp. YIM 134122]|uniref:Uncharacterized protein n=1 Tax=Leifsonia stereocauli TaxID=3134136 RepID=A0ABU9W5U1_9MICO
MPSPAADHDDIRPFTRKVLQIAQMDPSGHEGVFASRERLAYDYRAGVDSREHGIARSGEHLLKIMGKSPAHPKVYDEAERAVKEWAAR